MAYCFAWDQNNRGVWGCKATTIDCNGMDESCPFYKTVEQHRADREAANERLASLHDWQQTAIADEYYGSEKPWMHTAPKLDSIISGMVEDVQGR